MQLAILALLTTLSTFAQAAPDYGEPPSRTSCTTEYGKSRVQWSTHWSTYWEPCTTARGPVTDKGWAKTVTHIVTRTSVTTTTLTASTTSKTTSTVPASSGLPGSSYSGSGGADPVAKRDSPDHSNVDAQKHVIGVECHVWKPEICVRGATTVTSTRTTISTSTVTKTPTTISTVYAACATNNLADHFSTSGSTFGINGVSPGAAGNVQNNITALDSAYDCCVLAIQTPGTQVFEFQPASDGAAGTCNLFSQPSITCSGQASGGYAALSKGPSFGLVVVGNAYCGVIDLFINQDIV